MQPDFHDFLRGLRYTLTVKTHFRKILRFYQLVSIQIVTTNVAILLFLTAGNK